MVEIVNAQIESTMLGYEDHGIMTCFLDLRWNSAGQGFGGYRLDKATGPYGMRFIERILKTVGVSKWEDLKGKFVKIEQDHSKVYRIGHIIEDRWFDPESEREELLKTE